MKTTIVRSFSTFTLLSGVLVLLASAALGQRPYIVVPPQSQAVLEGGTAYLSVSVTGELPITYTWHRNFERTNYYQATLDSTTCSIVLSNMTPDQACFFNLDVQNAYGYSPGAQAVVAVLGVGMETNGFALSLYGLTNSVWRVECMTNLNQPWFVLTNLSLPRTSFFKFVDLEATNGHRFYRVTPKVY